MDNNQKLQAKFSFVYIILAFLAFLLIQEYVIAPQGQPRWRKRTRGGGCPVRGL